MEKSQKELEIEKIGKDWSLMVLFCWYEELCEGQTMADVSVVRVC